MKINLKEFWKKVKAWHIGGIIGGIIGLIVGYLYFICHGEDCIVFNLYPPVLAGISIIFSMLTISLIQDYLSDFIALLLSILLFSIPYFITGALIGYAINPQKPKWVKNYLNKN